MNNNIEVENTIAELLRLKKFSDIFTLLSSEGFEITIKENSLNLVNIVCSTIREHQEELFQHPDDIESCSQILDIFIEKGAPKEVLVSLFEALDSFNDNNYFRFLLTPIQKVLFKVPKKSVSLECMLGVMFAHFNILPKPENKFYEGEECMLLDLDENVQKTSVLLLDYIYFLKPFLEEVCINSENMSDELKNEKRILRKHILTLLYNPLIFQDLHFLPNRQLSSIQSSCQKLLKYLGKMHNNLIDEYIFHIFKDFDSVDSLNDNQTIENEPFLSFGNLSYLMFVENLLPEQRPYVYASGFLFERHFPFINAMLSQQEYLVIYKGVHLCKTLLDLDFELPATNAPLSLFIEFSKTLVNSAVYCPVEKYRHMLAESFICYIKKFSWMTRYTVILSLISAISDSRVQGLLVNVYKNFLYEAKCDKKLLKYFTGKNLHKFIKQAVYLKQGVKTDLLENHQYILCGLNFIRYLIVVDSKAENSTGIFDIIDDIKESYLKPLQMGIDISTAHYQQEAKNAANDISLKKTLSQTTVTINGENSQISTQEYSNAMKQALVSLDLIQSVLSRVSELIDQEIKK